MLCVVTPGVSGQPLWMLEQRPRLNCSTFLNVKCSVKALSLSLDIGHQATKPSDRNMPHRHLPPG